MIVSESDFSATQAIASEVCPTKYSPIISSVVVVEELLIDVRSIEGADGVPSTVTMEAWSKVPKDFQDIANSIAESTLSIWNQTHIKELVQKSSDNKC